MDLKAIACCSTIVRAVDENSTDLGRRAVPLRWLSFLSFYVTLQPREQRGWSVSLRASQSNPTAALGGATLTREVFRKLIRITETGSKPAALTKDAS